MTATTDSGALGFSTPSDTPYLPTVDLNSTVFGLVLVRTVGLTSRMSAAVAPSTVMVSMSVTGMRAFNEQMLEEIAAQSAAGPMYEDQVDEILGAMGKWAYITPVLIEEIVLAVSRASSSRASFADSAEFVVARGLAFRVVDQLLAENGVATDAMIVALVKGLTIQEAVAATSAVSSVLSAMVQVGESLMARGDSRVISEESIAAHVQMSAAAAGWARISLGLLENASVQPSVAPSAVLTVLANEGVSVGTHLSLGGVFSAILDDGLSAYVTFNVGGETFTCWCTNAENLASSEYRGYNFNSLCTIDGKYYAAGEGGVYLLEGDTDDGKPIRASVLTGLSDFGSPALKHVPAGYVSRTASGDMMLKVVTVTDGRKQVNAYAVKNAMSDAYRTTQVPFGKGLRARYWQLELSNVDGVDFAVDEIELSPAVSMRRI